MILDKEELVIVKSITIEINIIFKIVPNPGFCFKGYHNIIQVYLQ